MDSLKRLESSQTSAHCATQGELLYWKNDWLHSCSCSCITMISSTFKAGINACLDIQSYVNRSIRGWGKQMLAAPHISTSYLFLLWRRHNRVQLNLTTYIRQTYCSCKMSHLNNPNVVFSTLTVDKLYH